MFRETVDPSTGEIAIKPFVEKLHLLDQSLTKSELFRTCHFLDENSSGTISLDEFIVMFSAAEEGVDGAAEQDGLLQDEMWPSWVVKEKKLPELETLLSKVFKQLYNKFGLTPEQAFGMFDYKDTGLCSVQEFKRVVDSMFSEVVTNER